LLASPGSKAKAIDPATNERMVGYQTTFSTQRSQTAKKAALLPKASLTQTKIPPRSGQPVASSAEMKAVGRKKTRRERRRKKMEASPYSAVRGQLRILKMVAKLIIVRRKTFNEREDMKSYLREKITKKG